MEYERATVSFKIKDTGLGILDLMLKRKQRDEKYFREIIMGCKKGGKKPVKK